MKKKIFAFDLGKTSIGICARNGNDILDLKSLIINSEYANISENRDRKRVIKTREAHKLREEFFINEIWVKSKLEPLSKEDNRFKKEFPAKNEAILYSSTLLRIALLQNKPLEKWQIFKALYNSLQRRGYDSNLPWMANKKREKDKSDEESAKYVSSYKNLLKAKIPNEDYHFPCYLDATLLGLWNYLEPQKLYLRVNHFSEPARYKDRVAPRSLVEKELRQLFDNAKRQLPELQNISTEYFLYGEGEIAYASYENPEYRKNLGKAWDNQGVLSQKIPRFENRILSKCQLMPKRNVCKANTIENIKFVLLMGLKNFRYSDLLGNKISLTAEEIKKAYSLREPDLLKYIEEGKLQNCRIGSKNINDAIKPKKLPKGTEIDIKVNTAGRSRFCKPALNILSEIILSGQNPCNFDITPYIQNKDETSPQKGITRREIEKLLSRIGDSWENIHIGDNRDEIAEAKIPKEQQIAKLIGSTSNPVVRHRLQWFYNEIKILDKEYGEPDEIIIEFVRGKLDDVLAQKYVQNTRELEKYNQKLVGDLKRYNIPIKSGLERLKLLEQQKYKCVYTGENIAIHEILNCEIDHIVPVSKGGCDSLWNKVLCLKSANQEKAGRTPYEWLSSNDEEWIKYSKRIADMDKALGSKKTELLRSPNALENIEHYNGLAETAQIARMAQQIASIHFNWGLQTKGDKRSVFVSTGSQTAEFRRRYKLNELLGDDKTKNRSNLKHHALDAVCISYSRELKSLQKPNGEWYRGVEGFQRDYVIQKFNELMPKTVKPNTSKQKIKETIYGKRQRGKTIYLAVRKELIGIKKEEKAIKNILDEDIKADLLEKAKIITDAKEWEEMLKNYTHPKKNSKVKKVRIIAVKTDKIEPPDANERERIGEYCDFGNKGTMGQFKAADSHQGQFIYFDEKNVPRIMPVYANQKKSEVEIILKNKGYKLYKNGMFFYSSVQLYIPKDFKAGKETYPKGIYELNTMITETSVVKVKNSNGDIITSSIKYLIEADFELYNNKKLVKKD